MTTTTRKPKAKTKTYRSVVDYLHGEGCGEDQVSAVEDAIRRTEIVGRLSVMRSSRGISQARVAELLGVQQSAVSKIENKYDAHLTLGEIEAYAKALGYGVEIRLSKSMTLVERVRHHASRLSSLIEELAGMVKGDKEAARHAKGLVHRTLIAVGEALGKLDSHVPTAPTRPPRSPTLTVLDTDELPDTATVVATAH
jgi:transcriptional regulator with XRE-family HTH domain